MTKEVAAAADGPRLAYQPALDGLRGLAVLAVVLFHAEIGWAKGGFLGVSAFFTLSGYLIATLLLREHDSDGRIQLRRFYARRVRRLLPGAALGLLLAAAYVFAVGVPLQAESFRYDGLFSLFNLANWRFIFSGQTYSQVHLDVTGARSPVLHFWSLAIEEQFYLVFPPLFAFLLSRTRERMGVVVALVAGLTTATFGATLILNVVRAHDGAPIDRYYYGSDVRAGELLIGVLLALLLHRRALSRRVSRWLPLAGVGALGAVIASWSTIDFGRRGLFRGGLAVHALTVAVVIVASQQRGPVRDVLALGPLRWLGKISYGVYLFHWPLFQWIDPRHTGLTGATLLLVRAAATLAVALASYWLVEQPIRRGTFPTVRWRRPAIPVVLVGTAAVILVVVALAPQPSTVFGTVGSADRPPDFATASSLPETNGSAGVADPNSASTTVPRPARPMRILVVGDSVGQTMGRGFERWGPTHGAAVWNRARFFCGLGRGGVYKLGLIEQSPSAECDAWPAMFEESVTTFDPDVTIVLNTLWDSLPRQLPGWPDFSRPGLAEFDEWLATDYSLAADILSANGGAVVWMKIPCNEGQAQGDNYMNVNRVIERVARLHSATMEAYPLDALLCDPPPALADARRDDKSHFTDPGADALAAHIGNDVLVVARSAASRRG